jgi:hypothetical protein
LVEIRVAAQPPGLVPSCPLKSKAAIQGYSFTSVSLPPTILLVFLIPHLQLPELLEAAVVLDAAVVAAAAVVFEAAGAAVVAFDAAAAAAVVFAAAGAAVVAVPVELLLEFEFEVGRVMLSKPDTVLQLTEVVMSVKLSQAVNFFFFVIKAMIALSFTIKNCLRVLLAP